MQVVQLVLVAQHRQVEQRGVRPAVLRAAPGVQVAAARATSSVMVWVVHWVKGSRLRGDEMNPSRLYSAAMKAPRSGKIQNRICR